MPNEDVNMVLGAFQTLGRGMQPYVDEQFQDRARNRELSPYEKWLGKAVSGQLPVDIAVKNAQLEMAGHQIPDQLPGLESPMPGQPMPQVPNQPGVATPQQGLSSMSAAPQGVANMAAQTPYQPQGLGSNRIQQVSGPVGQGMQQPQGLGAMPQSPQTAGDMQALAQFGGMMRPRGKTQEELMMELLKEQGRNNRNTQNVGSRENIAGGKLAVQDNQYNQTLQFKVADLQQRWQEALLRADTAMRAVSSRTGSSERIQAARIAAGREASNLRTMAMTFMTDPYLMQDVQARGLVQKLAAELESRAQLLDNTVDNAMRSGSNTRPNTSSSTTIKQPTLTTPSAQDLMGLFGKGK